MKKQGFLGIDVSKGYSNFVLMDKYGKILVKNFKLYDTKEGHEELVRLIKVFLKKHSLDELVMGLESTGGYEDNWYYLLKGMSSEVLKIKRINPRFIHFEGKAVGAESTSDKVSATLIAGYLRKNYHDLNFDEWERPEEQQSARKLYKYTARMVKDQTKIKNALEKLLYCYMPELLAIKGDKYPNWFLTLLTLYPSRRAILEAGADELSKIAYLTKERAEGIVASMTDSVGKPGDMYIEMAIGGQAEDIQYLTKKLKKNRRELADLMGEVMAKDLEIVESIGGIGIDSSVAILLEIGDVKRFPDAKKLVAYFGINPTVKQSGDKKVKIGMSKNGSSSARAILYMAAGNVSTKEPYFQEMYKDLRTPKGNKRAKKHKEALCVIMAKLTKVIYGMLKNGTTFNRKVDEANKDKKPLVPKEGSRPRNGEERFQSEPGLAPISVRQKVLRRKQKQEELNKESLIEEVSSDSGKENNELITREKQIKVEHTEKVMLDSGTDNGQTNKNRNGMSQLVI